MKNWISIRWRKHRMKVVGKILTAEAQRHIDANHGGIWFSFNADNAFAELRCTGCPEKYPKKR